jgi:tripartite-type tricarboxylate transporter receptor subunit TctC
MTKRRRALGASLSPPASFISFAAPGAPSTPTPAHEACTCCCAVSRNVPKARRSQARQDRTMALACRSETSYLGGHWPPSNISARTAMRLHRREFLHLAASAVALPALSGIARAQTYPERPVRLIVSAAAGGPTDVVARIIGQWLSERLGQQFLVENRAGGSNNIGTEAVVRSRGDGYTLLVANSVNAINASLFDRLNFYFIRDMVPVASIAVVPNVMEVHPSVPVMSVSEFVAYAKANPAKLNMGSGGNGTPAHVAGELFKLMTGVKMTHVPYRGGAPMLTDLLGGQVQVAFETVALSIDHIRTGRLRALGVTSAARWDGLPGIPTVAEVLPGFEASTWFGICAPKNTPTEIIDKLNLETNAGLADPKVKARLNDLSYVALPGSPADFGKLIATETEKWGKVIRAANIKAG